MRVVQFDENLNAGHLEKACLQEGLIEPHRFPNRFARRGMKDPDVLSYFLPLQKLLLTNDREIVTAHLDYISDEHCGILIIEQDESVTGQMTTHLAQRILAQFKKRFPRWHEVPWRNSIICLSPMGLQILHVESSTLQPDSTIVNWREPGWEATVESLLVSNATRSLSFPQPQTIPRLPGGDDSPPI